MGISVHLVTTVTCIVAGFLCFSFFLRRHPFNLLYNRLFFQDMWFLIWQHMPTFSHILAMGKFLDLKSGQSFLFPQNLES